MAPAPVTPAAAQPVTPVQLDAALGEDTKQEFALLHTLPRH